MTAVDLTETLDSLRAELARLKGENNRLKMAQNDEEVDEDDLYSVPMQKSNRVIPEATRQRWAAQNHRQRRNYSTVATEADEGLAMACKIQEMRFANNKMRK